MADKEQRIDKWIWAMRIFKTRTIATEACKKGRVTVGSGDNAIVAKPSRTIKVGDVVNVKKPPVTYSFRVKALSNGRLGAKLVPEYLENITSQDQFDLLDMVAISGFINRRKGLGRPTKREARDLQKFTSETYDLSDFMFEDDFDDELDEFEEFEESEKIDDYEASTGHHDFDSYNNFDDDYSDDDYTDDDFLDDCADDDLFFD